MSYILVNTSHRITDSQLEELTSLVGTAPVRVVDVEVQFDDTIDFEPQTVALIGAITAAGVRLGEDTIVLNPPAHSAIASVLLAALHGQCGGFPSIIRMSRVGATVSTWSIAELINLQVVREAARRNREGHR
jgi:hypothetical protein